MKTRKSTAILLAAAMLFQTAVTLISGCSKSEETAQNNYYTVTEWLSKVEDTFNMNYYTEEEPLIQSVLRDNPAYDTIQTAAEWELISAEDNLDFNSTVTKEFCADTLVTAMNFTDLAEVDIADSDKINASYLDNVKVSVNEGVFSLENGSFDPQKKITKAEADQAMLVARSKWVNSSFGGVSYDKSVVKDGVVNLGGVRSENYSAVAADYSVQYTGSRQFFDADGNYTDNTKKTITFKKSNMPELSVGTILALPGDDVVPMDYAVRVTRITENPDGTVTVETENVTAEDVYEEIDMQYSGELDLSDAILFGPDGTRLEPEKSTGNMGMYLNDEIVTGNAMSYAGADSKLMDTAVSKGEYSYKLCDGVTLKFTLDGKKLKVSVDVKVEDNGTEATVNLTKTASFSVEDKIEWGFAKLSVKSFKFAVTANDSTEVAVSLGTTLNFGSDYSKISDMDHDGKSDKSDLLAEMKVLKQVYQQLSKEWLGTNKLGSLIKDKTNAKLVDLVIPNTPIHFVIRADLTFEAKYTNKIENKTTFGAEYVKKHLRLINEKNTSQEESISGKVELTFKLAFELTALGVNLADVGTEIGGGFKCSSKVYRVNPATGVIIEECALPVVVSVNNQLPPKQESVCMTAYADLQMADTYSCSEAVIYPIFKVYALSKGSLVGKFIGGIDAEFLGEDNGKVLSHYESDNGFVDECTRGMSDSYNVKAGDGLTTNYDNLLVSVGETNKALKLITLPKGIKLYDVKITSDNPDVLKATNLMQASAEKPEVKVSVRLGKHTASIYYKASEPDDKEQIALEGLADGVANVVISCASQTLTIPVKVGNGGIENESESTFVVKNTSINLRGGESDNILIEAAPQGYDISQVTFTSCDKNIATVDKNGKVTAMSGVTGSVIIVISTNDGKYNAACLVNVLPQTSGST